MSDDTIQQLQALTGGGVLLFAFFGILWWVLCVVLFFKVWGMTNDVNEMKATMKEWFDLEHPLVETDKEESKPQTEAADQP
jgi:hypothetical protein